MILLTERILFVLYHNKFEDIEYMIKFFLIL